MSPRVEIRVPVSPTRAFALMTAVLYRSLVDAAGLDDFRLSVVVGAPPEDQAAARAFGEWLEPVMDAIIVDPDRFAAEGIHATAMHRLEVDSVADVLVLMDADMVACGSLQELCADLEASPAVTGVVAHAPPLLTAADWRGLYAKAGLGEPAFPYRYTGWPYLHPTVMATREDSALAPPYFNFGFVAAPPAVLAEVAPHLPDCERIALDAITEAVPDELVEKASWFRSQVGFTLAIERSGVPHHALGMRYNFPNDFRLEALHPEELGDARVIHLLRRTQGWDKTKTFDSVAALRAFAATGWRTVGALERARVRIAAAVDDIEAMGLPARLAESRWIW